MATMMVTYKLLKIDLLTLMTFIYIFQPTIKLILVTQQIVRWLFLVVQKMGGKYKVVLNLL